MWKINYHIVWQVVVFSELSCFLWLFFVEFRCFCMVIVLETFPFPKIFPKWYNINQHVLLTILCNLSHGRIPVGNFKFGKSTTTWSGKWLCSLSLGPTGLP